MAQIVTKCAPIAVQALSKSFLVPVPGTISTSGDVSSGPMNTLAQIPISTQDKKSVTSNPFVTARQSPGNLVIDNTVTQSTSSILQPASSSSSLAVTVIPLPDNPVALYTSSISSSSPAITVSQMPISQSSSSTNYQSISVNSISPIPASHLADTPRIHSTSSSSTLAPVVTQLSNNAISQYPSPIYHQSSSSFNNGALPSQLQQLSFNTVTHNTSSVGYQGSPSSSLNSNPSHTLPLDSTLTDSPLAQIFPATTLAVITDSLATQTTVPGAVTGVGGLGIVELTETGIVPTGASAMSTAQGPVATISASMGIFSPGTSAMQHGGVNGSSVITGGGSATGSDGAATGKGNSTKSVPGHTNVSTVFTGGTERVNGWSNRLLGFGLLVWEVGMVFWV